MARSGFQYDSGGMAWRLVDWPEKNVFGFMERFVESVAGQGHEREEAPLHWRTGMIQKTTGAVVAGRAPKTG